MKTHPRGQILPIVMMSLVVLLLIVAGLTSWIQNDMRTAVKVQKDSSSAALAEAGVDRGIWKLQSTTSTFAAAQAGGVIPGYNFDTTYNDIPGGSYRIKFTAGAAGSRLVTVTAEGRDSSTREVRAIAAVVKNQTVYSAMMSGGNVGWAQGLGVYWGPIIAQGDIILKDDNVARRYFPRKYSKGVVTTGPAVSAIYRNRDNNGLATPNTDNVEWWSEYPGVPNVPVLDFVSMRSSAAATNTLNVYGCKNSAQYTINGVVVPGWDLNASCGSASPSHATHFGNSTNFYNVRGLDPNKDYVWYWDGDVSLEGSGYNSTKATSMRGTVIVRGTLTIESSGDMRYTANVSTNAWQEEQKLLVNTFDTAASDEYPDDTGFHQNGATWRFGTDTWHEPGFATTWINTVGIRGFVYVGGNLNVISYLDIHGAVWVNGNIMSAYPAPDGFCGIYYDENLQVPTLNVILLRQSWQEVSVSNTAWP